MTWRASTSHPRAILTNLVDLINVAPDIWDTVFQSNTTTLITFVNPLAVRTAQAQPTFIDMLRRFDFVLADGVLLALVARRIRGRHFARTSFDGNSAAPAILEACARAGRGIYLVGGPDGAAEVAGNLFSKTFGVSVLGTKHGHFENVRSRFMALDAITKSNADVVIAGMGSYIQEKFLLDLIARGWGGTGLTCGAYLEQVARSKRICYYPNAFDKLNLRAFFRLLHEPRKMLLRYTKHYVPFYLAAASLLWGTSMGLATENQNFETREPRI